MKILLFGISNVGKSTIGKIIADIIDYDFFDLDEEVKKRKKMTLEEFVNTGWITERDAYRRSVIDSLINENENFVLSVSPLSYYGRELSKWLDDNDVLAVELVDSVWNVYERLVFSDENDVVYKDDEYRDEHSEYYLKSIKEDFEYYGKRYQYIPKFNINGKTQKVAANNFLREFSQFLPKSINKKLKKTHNEKRKIRLKSNFYYINKNISEGVFEKLIVDDAILELYDKFEKAKYNKDVGKCIVNSWPKIVNTIKNIFRNYEDKPGYDLLMKNQTAHFNRGKFICYIFENLNTFLMSSSNYDELINIVNYILDFFSWDFDIDYKIYFKLMIPEAFSYKNAYDLCDDEFNKLFKEYPSNCQVIKKRAMCWLDLGEIDKAKNLLEKYININSKIDGDNSILFPVIVYVYSILDLNNKAKLFHEKHLAYLKNLKLGEGKTKLDFFDFPEGYW